MSDERPEPVVLAPQTVRIVAVDLPFSTVLVLVLQVWAATAVLAGAVGLFAMLFYFSRS